MTKLVPYSVYLSQEHYDKIRQYAKNRKASSMVRDAITMIIDGNDPYKAGYGQAIRDAIKIVDACKEIEHFAFKGKYLNDILIEKLNKLDTSTK
jgi:hypothetical protein